MNTILSGNRIRLFKMVDPYPVPPHTAGVIAFVDDINQIHVKWENGRTLAVIPDVDSFMIYAMTPEQQEYFNTLKKQ